MEQLNKIRVAAENSIRERARKQAEARVAELERELRALRGRELGPHVSNF